MTRILFLFIFALMTFEGFAQTAYNHQLSSTPESSRFQIVQSEYGVRFTFIFDKFTGKVFQLVENKIGLTWQIIEAEIQDHDTRISDQVNYQFFTSGLGVRYTFLLNINTGITWQLVEDSTTGTLFWKALK